MGRVTTVQWCCHTFNGWEGCQKKSAGCKNCFAWRRNVWLRKGENWGPQAQRRPQSDAYWQQPVVWNRAAAAAGERRRVFCGSTMDWTDPLAPPGARDRLRDVIFRTPCLDWLLLTKDPHLIPTCLPPDWARGGESYGNVWLGTSVENQEEAWRIDELLKVKAAVLFLSVEPLLGSLNIRGHLMKGRQPAHCGRCGHGHAFVRCPNYGHVAQQCHHAGCQCSGFLRQAGRGCIDWVVVGGESGPGARPCDLAWIHSIIEQCDAAGVPVFCKQLGSRPIDAAALCGECRHARSEHADSLPAPCCHGMGAALQAVEENAACSIETLVAATNAGCRCSGFVGRADEVQLLDRKGGDESEWPLWARRREYPCQHTMTEVAS